MELTLNYEDQFINDSSYNIFAAIYRSISDSSSASYSGSFGVGVSF
ncbi:MAG: hypothetical protein ABL930_05515 [Pseudobdellovibrio sp.]